MKKLFTLLIVAAAALVAAPKAEARPYHSGYTYVSGRSSCGCMVYSQRYVVRYDHCGHPVYSVRRLPVTHRCRATTHYRPQYQYRHRGQPYVQHRGRSYNRPYGHSYSHLRGRCR